MGKNREINMDNVCKEAGERIFKMRNMRGYTRECLAEMAGISTKFLYEIESGKKGFSIVVLYSLCCALNIGSDYILTGNKDVKYDKKLVTTLELFKKEQGESLVLILKGIYNLINSN